MKKTLCFCLLLLVNIALFSQNITSPQSSIKTDYLKKSKNQKTAAWILLGGGATLTVIGGALALNNFGTGLGNILNPRPQKVNDGAATVCAVTGVVSMVASIPLFISASQNKHKAFSIAFKNDLVPQLRNYNITKVNVPAVSLVIRF